MGRNGEEFFPRSTRNIVGDFVAGRVADFWALASQSTDVTGACPLHHSERPELERASPSRRWKVPEVRERSGVEASTPTCTRTCPAIGGKIKCMGHGGWPPGGPPFHSHSNSGGWGGGGWTALCVLALESCPSHANMPGACWAGTPGLFGHLWGFPHFCQADDHSCSVFCPVLLWVWRVATGPQG